MGDVVQLNAPNHRRNAAQKKLHEIIHADYKVDHVLIHAFDMLPAKCQKLLRECDDYPRFGLTGCKHCSLWEDYNAE